MLVEGAEESAGGKGEAAASMHGLPDADAAAAAYPAGRLQGTSKGLGQPQPALMLQVAAPAAQAEAGPSLLGLLEQAMDVAAAAASDLTPKLVGAFAPLLPLLDAEQVSLAAALPL